MREFVRPVAAALGIACLAAAVAVVSSDSASGAASQAAGPAETGGAAAAKQAAPPPAQEAPIKQMALTEKQVEGVLAASKEMDADHRQAAGERQAGSEVDAQLDGVAKKNGFASYDEYNDVVDNISMVLGGFDPATKKYVGTEAVSRRRSPRSRPTRRCRPRTRRKCSTISTRR